MPKKGMAIASLTLGVLSLPTLAGLFFGGALAVILEIVAALRANRRPDEYGGLGIAIAGIAAGVASFLIAVPLAGIIAAIAIPGLLRARAGANEAVALSTVRAVISAETAYSTANAGYFDTIDCLKAPSTCIPQYSGDATTSIFSDIASGLHVQSGYILQFHAGPVAAPDEIAARRASKSSVTSFAFTAVPETWEATGRRAFCGDSSGRVCETRNVGPSVAGGLCAPSCPDVQ